MGVVDSLRSLKLRYQHPHRYKWIRSRTRSNTAPFGVSLYRLLLEKLASTGELTFLPFCEPVIGGARSVYVRHDVDTEDCVKKLRLLTAVNGELGIPTAIYFRVDDLDYRFDSCIDLILDHKERGFEVGLHTSCYVSTDPLGQFAEETQKFLDFTGFSPTSFTFHGLGNQHLLRRRRTALTLSTMMHEFNYTFSDCHPSLRTYDHVYEDCHRDTEGNRVVFNDFEDPATVLQNGTVFLILTHPCYWQQ